VDTPLYPARGAWYQSSQPFLPFADGMARYGTAADAVYRGFDLGLLLALEARYLLESARLSQREERIALLTEKHGFVAGAAPQGSTRRRRGDPPGRMRSTHRRAVVAAAN